MDGKLLMLGEGRNEMISKKPGSVSFSGAFAAVAIAAAAVVAGAASPASAKREVPDTVKVACSGDYKKFCGKYTVGSTKLDRCMRSNGKRLSNVCVRALVDHGMVPRSALRRARNR